MRDRIVAYRVLVGKPEGRRPLERVRHRWEDNIRIDLCYVLLQVVHQFTSNAKTV
jgi:hypothetical protein